MCKSVFRLNFLKNNSENIKYLFLPSYYTKNEFKKQSRNKMRNFDSHSSIIMFHSNFRCLS